MDILKLVVGILIILGLYKLCFQWPVNINREFNSRYGQQGWSLLISIILAVLVCIIILEQGNLLTQLLCFIVFLAVSFFAYARIIVKCELVSASKTEIPALIFAQFLSAVGIIFIILFLLEVLSKKRKRK